MWEALVWRSLPLTGGFSLRPDRHPFYVSFAKHL
jgi:hypothetical protein